MEHSAFSCNSVPLLFCRYCKVFQYLLRLKRIQLELEKSWAEAMQQDRADSAKQRRDAVNGTSATQRQQQRMPMWRIRQHMTYLITNLQFYIQVHYHTIFLIPHYAMTFWAFIREVVMSRRSHSHHICLDAFRKIDNETICWHVRGIPKLCFKNLSHMNRQLSVK